VRGTRQVGFQEVGHGGQDHRAQGEPYQRAGHAEAGGQKGRQGRGYPDRYDLSRVEDGLLLPFVQGIPLRDSSAATLRYVYIALTRAEKAVGVNQAT
jgi:hypothetical protein